MVLKLFQLGNGENAFEVERLKLKFGEVEFFIREEDTLVQSLRENAESKHQVWRKANVANCFRRVAGCVNHTDLFHLWTGQVGHNFALVNNKKRRASLQSFD